MAIRRIEGLLHLASEGRYAILVGRFNSFVVEHLLEGAIDTLKRHGVSEDNITVAYAPGAWELPIVAKKLAASDKFESTLPVINGVLTTDSIEQAIERSGTKAGNKGSEAALTAIEMVNLLKAI